MSADDAVGDRRLILPPTWLSRGRRRRRAGADVYQTKAIQERNLCSIAQMGTVQVSRFVGAYGAGRIINRKTAESQLRGAVVMGIGAALLEETVMDAQRGHVVNANLGEYHIAVNADVPELDVFFVEEADPHIGPLGAKGVGELGIVGFQPRLPMPFSMPLENAFENFPLPPTDCCKELFCLTQDTVQCANSQLIPRPWSSRPGATV